MFPPLWGTRLFPLAAKQEKLHFVVATHGQSDRFDGVPDYAYLEDVRIMMNKIMAGWDQKPLADSWLQLSTRQHASDFMKKFPFAGQRLDDRCFTRGNFSAKISVRNDAGTVMRQNPPPRNDDYRPVGAQSIASSSRPQRRDPRRSEDELRLAQVNSLILISILTLVGFFLLVFKFLRKFIIIALLQDIQIFFQLQSESTLAGQTIRDPTRYKPHMIRNAELFNNAILHFQQHGDRWPRSEIFNTSLVSVFNMTAYEQFEDWIFQTQPMYRGLETLPMRT